MRYTKEKIKELTGIDINTDYGYIEVVDENQYKTNSQNNLFHSLLQCYFLSGCSSFSSYDVMRDHYKEVAGLIEVEKFCGLSAEAKQMLWKAIKLLPLERSDYNELIRLLKGETKVIHSWSDVTKENARVAINQLMDDMYKSNVLDSCTGKKYEQILIGIGDWFDER